MYVIQFTTTALKMKFPFSVKNISKACYYINVPLRPHEYVALVIQHKLKKLILKKEEWKE